MLIKWNECISTDFDSISKDDIALIVVSSLEQHALHLPTGTDEYIGMAVAEGAAQKSKRKVYLMPSVNYGFSYHHLKFKGSVSIKQSNLIGVIKDIVKCTYASGFKNIVILNSHGGNMPALGVAVNELGTEGIGKIALIRYWDFIGEFVSQIRESELGGIGHAGEMETSLMLHIKPELVDKSKLLGYKLAEGNKWHNPDMFAKNKVTIYKDFSEISPTGNVGIADFSNEQKGKAILEYTTNQISDFLDTFF